MHWLECCSAFHYLIPFCLQWSRRLQHHHEVWRHVSDTLGYSLESWHCMILFTNHTTVIHKVAHSQQCMYMQCVLCNVMEYIKLILWSWQRCFLRVCVLVYFVSCFSNTFLWIWLVTPSLCQGTFTMLLMTAVYL